MAKTGTRRIWAIGDIHGDAEGMFRVLKQMSVDGLDWNRDLIVQLGDLVDGLPRVREVVEFWKAMQERHPENVIVLYGNHEEMLCNAWDADPNDWPTQSHWWYQGGRETYISYRPFHGELHQRDIRGTIPVDHVNWLNTRPNYHETDEYIFVHAGLRPPLLPAENDPSDLIWIRDEFIDSEHDFGRVIVYGHTPFPTPQITPTKICINTRDRSHRGYVSGIELRPDGQHTLYSGK